MTKPLSDIIEEGVKEIDNLFAPDGDTINQILEYRGIYDGGKCFKEDEEQHYLVPLRLFLRSFAQRILEAGKKEGAGEERQRCLRALPPERIIHEYMPSQNTPENRAWNEYRSEAIKAITEDNN